MSIAEQHLLTLRKLLARDYLQNPDLDSALKDFAQVVRRALQARESMIAFWEGASQSWSAVNSRGIFLDNSQMSLSGSQSVLERVRETKKPVLATSEDHLGLTSESISTIQVDGVLSVPLFWWDLTAGKPSRSFGGCVYVHRVFGDEPFTEEDITLMVDLTRMVQPIFNLFSHLKQVQVALEASQEEVKGLRKQFSSQYRLGDYESQDPWFAENVLGVLETIRHADRVGLLFLGPTGSGKTHLAQCYHNASNRKEGPFVVLDCSQITSSETMAAELFGYAPHSGYVNAPAKGRSGKARLAHQGTLFIDEISCLPLELQQRLLRLLEAGIYSPLGASEEEVVDLQIISATNKDLQALVQEKTFREDLFWRLSEVTIQLPPLSEHPADIPHLASIFLKKASKRYKKELTGFTHAALRALQACPWEQQGNIRGLEHTISRSVLMASPKLSWLDAQDIKFHGQMQRHSGFSKVESFHKKQRPSSPKSKDSSASTGRKYGEQQEDNRKKSAMEPKELRVFLEEKICEHNGVISTMANDPEIADALGYEAEKVPQSSLRLRLDSLELGAVLQKARQKSQKEPLSLDSIREAIQAHGSGSAAAKALGVTRDTLMWQLRKAGLRIRDLLST